MAGESAPVSPYYAIAERMTTGGAARLRRRWHHPDAPGLVVGLARWAVSTYSDEREVGCSRWVAARRVWRQRRWVVSS